jgi:hypothetical protein
MHVVLVTADFESWIPQPKELGRPIAVRQGDMTMGDGALLFDIFMSSREGKGER